MAPIDGIEKMANRIGFVHQTAFGENKTMAFNRIAPVEIARTTRRLRLYALKWSISTEEVVSVSYGGNHFFKLIHKYWCRLFRNVQC